MDFYRELFDTTRLLLEQEDHRVTAEALLLRLKERTGAERGFVVVKDGGSYRQVFDVAYSRDLLTSQERRFSRTVVRRVIAEGRHVYSPNLMADRRFAGEESAQSIGICSVLAAPLMDGDEVFGAVYLERRGEEDAFSAESRRFVEEISSLAGMTVRRAVAREQAERRRRELEGDLFARHDFQGIVTRDPAMLEVLQRVAQVADAEATVLILGESGTGKELIARALHVNSHRRHRPFVTVHCAALPASVMEAELFGHVAGAFTGARRDRAGRFAAAHGGTLLLDEVGELSPEIQAKLLRFLQFGEIQRLGSDRPERVDVRVVAATHRDLKAMSESGELRQDLFYRLRVLDLHLPPLRHRRGDIPLLLDHFLRRFWSRPGERPRWTAAAERALLSHPYPGNVRELAHAVERACLLARGEELGTDLLPPELTAASAAPEAVPLTLTREGLKAAKEAGIAAVERRFLDALLEQTGGNVSRAARRSGLHRSYLQKLLARHRVGDG